MQLKAIPTKVRVWFMISLISLLLCGVFTIIFKTGVLLYPTLYVEELLLHRPLTQFDCVFVEWKQLGEVGPSLIFTGVLAIVCLLSGYRRRMLPYLFLLMLLGVGAEYIGKQHFSQFVPDPIHTGINTLDCPQISSKPASLKVLVGLGAWWEAPQPHPGRIRIEQASANTDLTQAISANEGWAVFGYPSGHAMRWSFLGLVACYLVWRQMRRRVLRIVLMIATLLVAVSGGLVLFYIGLHFTTDLIGGYLIGFALACWAIGLLLLNEKKNRW
jgi:membrane-associated phospholipid phosphatase